MNTNNPLPTVQCTFEAFAKGDLDRLLETVHPDSPWTYVGGESTDIKTCLRQPERCEEILRKIIQNLIITTFHPREFVTEMTPSW
jgi:ketosteroid isomerase-like protein